MHRSYYTIKNNGMDEDLFHFDDDMFDISVPVSLLHKLECTESVAFQPKISKV